MGIARRTLSLVLGLFPLLLSAQEAKFIDLSAVSQRVELRYPPAPPSEGNTGGGYGGVSISDGAPDRRDPHAIGVFLLEVSPPDIDPNEPFGVELKVVNAGTVPITLPISPDLSDLQPADASRRFQYVSLSLVISIEGDWRHPVFAEADLYGADEKPETMLALQPGEWIRVKARVKPKFSPSESGSTRLQAGFLLRENMFVPHPGGSFTRIENLYPNGTRTPSLEVRIDADEKNR